MGVGGGPEFLVYDVASSADVQITDGMNPVGWAHLESILSGGGTGFNVVVGSGVWQLEVLREEGAE